MPRLLEAYGKGIFPWFSNDTEPVLWWSPDPRAVLRLEDFKASRSLRKTLRNRGFVVTMDTAFTRVVQSCATARRRGGGGTWITQSMLDAYADLHAQGYAHAVETWLDGSLVGGLYGVSLGRLFFGESMFTVESNASKVAFYFLVEQLKAWRFDLIDCQMMNDHLASLGAVTMERAAFLDIVARIDIETTLRGQWRLDILDA